MKAQMMKTLLSASVLTFAVTTHAGELNRPELSGIKMIGRIAAFPSPKNAVWYTGMAFSSELSCSPDGSGANRSCTLRVFNRLTNEELVALRSLVQPSQQLLSFRDVDPVVANIDEEFQALSPTLENGSKALMKTLAMDDRHFYANVAFRASKSEIAEVEKAYDQGGLGKFVSEVHLYGELTGDYLAISDTRLVRAVIEDARKQPVDSKSLREGLASALLKSDLKLNNYERGEAARIAAAEIVATYFRKGANRKLTPKEDVDMPSSLVLIDETYSPVIGVCRAELELKRGAVSKIDCGSNAAGGGQ